MPLYFFCKFLKNISKTIDITRSAWYNIVTVKGDKQK